MSLLWWVFTVVVQNFKHSACNLLTSELTGVLFMCRACGKFDTHRLLEVCPLHHVFPCDTKRYCFRDKSCQEISSKVTIHGRINGREKHHPTLEKGHRDYWKQSYKHRYVLDVSICLEFFTGEGSLTSSFVIPSSSLSIHQNGTGINRPAFPTYGYRRTYIWRDSLSLCMEIESISVHVFSHWTVHDKYH